MKKQRLNKSIIISILLIALLGAIMFFPINIKSGKTCLFHILLAGDEENFPGPVPYVERAHIMLHRYLAPFGFIWWFSLAMLALSIYHLKKSRIKSKRKHV